ncbi:hypothetical protein AGLY_017829 [Aphis glycines]|uniref:Uncharacterized protein n=1 Tax=Aphis glycines TaxID=307491 RepID=A0A6G0SUF3_APHGL|nr:hypothetical protein AGLY_017829 [Aphis glycines]
MDVQYSLLVHKLIPKSLLKRYNSKMRLDNYIITTLFSENFNRFRAENGTVFGFKRGRTNHTIFPNLSTILFCFLIESTRKCCSQITLFVSKCLIFRASNHLSFRCGSFGVTNTDIEILFEVKEKHIINTNIFMISTSKLLANFRVFDRFLFFDHQKFLPTLQKKIRMKIENFRGL